MIRLIRSASTVLAFLCVAISRSAANPITHSITLTPADPTDEWQVDLQPQMTAQLTVNVAQSGEANGRNWVLRGQPEVDFSETQMIWTGSMSGLTGTFFVVNTAPATERATVRVSCEWVPAAGGGGGPPPVIEGLATGTALPSVAQVSWSFFPSRVIADGIAAINWTLYFYNSEGQPVSTAIDDVRAVALTPPGADWTIAPTSGNTASLSGTVRSEDISYGRLEVRYSSAEIDVSDSVISFASPVYLEVFTPLE